VSGERHHEVSLHCAPLMSVLKQMKVEDLRQIVKNTHVDAHVDSVLANG
jgi:hypothetical protein